MLIIGNGRLITHDDAMPYLQCGAIAVEKNLIAKVGGLEEVKREYPGARFIDAKGGLIMPGLINAHNHIYSAFARGLSIKGYAPENFNDILEGMWWKLDRCLDNEMTRYSAFSTYVDCIKNGVTTVFDHHASYGEISGSLFTISEVARDLGVRTCLCYEVSDRDGEEKARDAIRENEAFIMFAKNDGSDMQKGMMGMHASFTLSDATIEQCLSHARGAPCHIHVAEGMGDVGHSLKHYGKRCVTRLFDLGVLGEGAIAGHCVHVDRHEMELLAQTGTTVVNNPQSNMGNAVGCAPVLQMLQAGVLVGMGTDGYTNDMLESYKTFNAIQKHVACHPAVAWGEGPALLFKNNALIANKLYQRPLGILKQGAYADVIVADYLPLTPMDQSNISGHLLFGLCGRSVTTTVINGKVLMENRVLTEVDEPELMAHSREQAGRLWAKINGTA